MISNLGSDKLNGIYSTPMAPYAHILEQMNNHDKEIVLFFLLESMNGIQRKNNLEIIRDKYKFLTISAETKSLFDGLAVSKDDLKDEKTRYILGRK
ncbi:MAG: hypothetical protein II939_05475 [Bacteroidales bacterium]|nr:hypothetical protein [Bacteroidales bacterium]